MVCVCKSDASRSFAASAFSVNASPTAMRRSTSRQLLAVVLCLLLHDALAFLLGAQFF